MVCSTYNHFYTGLDLKRLFHLVNHPNSGPFTIAATETCLLSLSILIGNPLFKIALRLVIKTFVD